MYFDWVTLGNKDRALWLSAVTDSGIRTGLNHFGQVMMLCVACVAWAQETQLVCGFYEEWADDEVSFRTSCTDTRGLCCQDLDTWLLQDLSRRAEGHYCESTSYLRLCSVLKHTMRLLKTSLWLRLLYHLRIIFCSYLVDCLSQIVVF